MIVSSSDMRDSPRFTGRCWNVGGFFFFVPPSALPIMFSGTNVGRVYIQMVYNSQISNLWTFAGLHNQYVYKHHRAAQVLFGHL